MFVPFLDAQVFEQRFDVFVRLAVATDHDGQTFERARGSAATPCVKKVDAFVCEPFGTVTSLTEVGVARIDDHVAFCECVAERV